MKVYKIILKTAKWIWQPKKLPYLWHMKFKMNDSGQILEGATEEEIVLAMMQTSKIPYRSTWDYMRDYSCRAVIFYNHDIRFVNEKDFLNDLLHYKHITQLQP